MTSSVVRSLRSSPAAASACGDCMHRAYRANPRLSRAVTAVWPMSQTWTAADDGDEGGEPQVVRAEQRPPGCDRFHPPADDCRHDSAPYPHNRRGRAAGFSFRRGTIG